MLPRLTRRRVVVALTVIAALLLAAGWMVWQHAPAAALLIDLGGRPGRLRPWLPARVEPVTTMDTHVPTRHGAVPARVYRPATATTRTVIVYPGIHAGDLNEPRLARFSRRLAAIGVTVITVPLPDLRRYRVTPASTDIIEDVTATVAGDTSLAPTGRVGVVGVSFAGGLALVAAGRERLADRLAFVVSLGGHGDLPRVMRYLGAVAPRADDVPPPHDYGAAVIMLAAVPHLVPPEQIAAVQLGIVTFLDASSLDATDKPASSTLFARARAIGASLPEPGRTILDLVNRRDVAGMGARVADHVETLGGAPALSPLRSPATPAPVFLIHGDRDNVIPAAETPAIANYLATHGNPRVQTVITPLLTHADLRDDPSLADLWRVVRVWSAILACF